MVTQGRADAVNIFLVDEVEGGGVLGIAAGIPGSLGIEGPHNGVLVSLGSHLSGPFFNQSLNNQLLAETIVHEAGHLLGLWHPTEDNGVEFDPLDDTAECSKSIYDSNNNGQVSAEECVGKVLRTSCSGLPGVVEIRTSLLKTSGRFSGNLPSFQRRDPS